MSVLPTGWATDILGSLIEFKYGKALPDKERTGDGFPVFGSNGQVGLHKTPLSLNETIIVGRKGSVGLVNYSNIPCSPIDTTYYVDSLPFGNFRYWFYQLKALRLSDLNKSTAIPGLSRIDAYALKILIPPEAEQRRIADKLDTVLTRVDVLNDRLAGITPLLKRFRQSVLAAATSGRLTEDWRAEMQLTAAWPLVSLGEVAKDFSYGSAAKSSTVGNIPVLRMGNIQNGSLDWQDLVYTSDEVEINKYRLCVGDVLFNRTNSPDLVGKTAVFKGEREAVYAGYLIRVKCSEKLNSDFLNYCLGSPAGRDYCWKVKSDGVSQSNINAKKLAAFEFELPSVAEQTEIVRRVEVLFAYADRLEARLQTARTAAERLTPALLAKAFRGELVPQDPNDEPASELLRRLREARAAGEGAAKPKRGRKAAGQAAIADGT